MEIDCPDWRVDEDPDSTIDSSSSNSRDPEESSSSAPKIAFTITCGADCPVIDRSALSNSDFESVPSLSESYFEKSVSAV